MMMMMMIIIIIIIMIKIIIMLINDNFYSTLSKSSKALHNQGEKSKVIFERNHSLK